MSRPVSRPYAALAVALDGATPPRECRIFKAGLNIVESDKPPGGRAMFDAKAAASVIAHQKSWGVRRMIDRNHRSLDPKLPSYDDASYGECDFELRDGELWAVNMTWTPKGAALIESGEMKYLSPVFPFDEEGRPLYIFNLALTANPATHDAQELAAAAARIRAGAMKKLNLARLAADPALMAKVLKAAGLNPNMIKDVAKALGLDESAGMPEIETALAAFAKKVEQVQGLLDDGAAEGDGESPPPAADAPPPAAAAEDPAMKAAAATAIAFSDAVAALTAKPTPSERLAEIERWRKDSVEADVTRAKLAADRAVLEAGEWDSIAVAVAKAVNPAVAWEDPLIATDRAKRKPATYLTAMGLPGARAYVAKLGAKPATEGGEAVKPPTSGDPNALTPEQLAICKRTGCDPAVFAQLRATTLPAGA